LRCLAALPSGLLDLAAGGVVEHAGPEEEKGKGIDFLSGSLNREQEEGLCCTSTKGSDCNAEAFIRAIFVQEAKNSLFVLLDCAALKDRHTPHLALSMSLAFLILSYVFPLTIPVQPFSVSD